MNTTKLVNNYIHQKKRRLWEKKERETYTRTLARPAAFALLLLLLIRQRRFNEENTFYFRQNRDCYFIRDECVYVYVCACTAFFSLKNGRRIPYFFCPLGDRHHIMTNKNKNKNKNENNMNNSKEETEGRDTPLSLYSAIVGGEGQDFVATTLSTSAQVCDTL